MNKSKGKLYLILFINTFKLIVSQFVKETFFVPIDAQIKKNDADKLKYKNDPAGYFGSIPNTRPSSLTASSNMAEEMEEDSMVQLVYVINNTIAASPLPPVITSRNVAKNNYVDQYRMAVLGA